MSPADVTVEIGVTVRCSGEVRREKIVCNKQWAVLEVRRVAAKLYLDITGDESDEHFSDD
jgi:hypothetical protein